LLHCITITAHTQHINEQAAEDRAAWTQWLTAYADRLRSENLDTAARAAATAAAATANPAYVLRNWIAQEAIDAAEKGDFTVVQSVLDKLTRPSEGEGETSSFAPPVWAADLICTCSS
jgi:serine/tyrosine/threonine adenylyltransferase